MNSRNPISKIVTNLPESNGGMAEATLYILPFVAPFIYNVIDKIGDFAHDAMEHRYDIKITVGPVDIALTKNKL